MWYLEANVVGQEGVVFWSAYWSATEFFFYSLVTTLSWSRLRWIWRLSWEHWTRSGNAHAHTFSHLWTYYYNSQCIGKFWGGRRKPKNPTETQESYNLSIGANQGFSKQDAHISTGYCHFQQLGRNLHNVVWITVAWSCYMAKSMWTVCGLWHGYRVQWSWSILKANLIELRWLHGIEMRW